MSNLGKDELKIRNNTEGLKYKDCWQSKMQSHQKCNQKWSTTMAQSLEDTNTYFRMVVLNYSILLQPLGIISERIHCVNGSDTFGSSVSFTDEKRSAHEHLLPKHREGELNLWKAALVLSTPLSTANLSTKIRLLMMKKEKKIKGQWSRIPGLGWNVQRYTDLYLQIISCFLGDGLKLSPKIKGK